MTATSAPSRSSAGPRWCSTTRSTTTRCTPTASRSPATTWCWPGRRSRVGIPAFDAASRAGLRRRRDGRLRAGAEEGEGDVRPGPRVRRLRPAVRRDVDDAVARDRRRARRRRRRRHHGPAGGRRPDDRPHRAGCGTPPGTSRPDLDLKRFPSSGPYKLDSVTEDGAVVLVANDKWWGAKPVTAKIIVWPRGADIQDRRQQRRLRRRRRRRRIVGHAQPARRLRAAPTPRRQASNSSIFAAAGAAGRPGGAARRRAVHAARRDRAQRRGADRQQPAQPRGRGFDHRRRERRRGRPVQRRQPRRGRATRSAVGR